MRLRGPASWSRKKCWLICNFGCLFVQGNEFVHNEMLSFVFLPSSSVKKKNRELFGYSFARWKWNVQDPGNLCKFSDFHDYQDSLKMCIFLKKNLFHMISWKLVWGSRLDESSRRKRGWRFTAGFEFIISGAFLFKLMHSFIMRCCHWYFPGKFNEKEN